ncbi:MAG: DUF2079 domain-containing protein [Elusimicrobia bacterium]|nr:DUF2079 domain-containing protein [Elusimicrobiota bacterium]
MTTWPEFVFNAANWLMLLLGIASGVAAGLVLIKKPLKLSRYFQALDPRKEFYWAIAIWGAAFPAWIVILKMAQHQNFQLTSDSAHVVHYAWNTIHGFGYYSSMYGMPTLSGHFSLTAALLSPFLLLWNNLNTFIMLHGLALGSTALGVYMIAKHRTDSRLLPWLLALLAISHPRFQDLMSTILEDSVFATPLFVWAVYFLDTKRPILAIASLALILTAKEEATAVLCGVGLYFMFCREKRVRLGGALVAASVLLSFFELAVIMRHRSALPADRFTPGVAFIFPALGNSAQEVISNLLHRPWIFPAALVYPPANLMPLLHNLLYVGLFPLLSGAAILPAYCTWLPHQLASGQFNYHRLLGYYSGFMLGPLLFATVVGATVAWKRVGEHKSGLLAAYILLISAIGFMSGGAYHTKLMPASWRTSVPKIIPLIPPDSKLWCEGYLTPHFALRRYIKYLPNNLPNDIFERDLYMPDQVLLSTYWMQISDPSSVERIMGFLRREEFQVIFQEKDLILFQRKGARFGAQPAVLLGDKL